jgi:Acetoacetate decarboxylase (ADC)
MFSTKVAADLPLETSRVESYLNQAAPEAARQFANDGAKLWWGDADTPSPPAVVSPGKPVSVLVAVSPMRPGYSVAVEHRVDGGPVCQAIATPESRAGRSNACVFRAVLPGQPSGTVEFLPVLRFAGQSISPRLGESAECSRYIVGHGSDRVVKADLPPPPSTQQDASRNERQADLPLQLRLLSDGTTCPLPIRYFNAYGLRAVFLVDFNRAAELLKGVGLSAVAQENGRAVASVGYFDYRKTDIGPYRELSLSVTAAAPGHAELADYIFNLAVTTATAKCAGREVWGYNKFLATIEGTHGAEKFSMTTRDSGNTTIAALEGARTTSVPMPPVDEFLFSLLGGRVIRTLLRVMTPSQVCGGDRFVVRIGPSRHPMADNLRNLGLDGARAVLVQYADPYQAMLFPGQAI